MLLRSGADGAGDLYGFGPGLTVSIRGERRARAYFRAGTPPPRSPTQTDMPAVEATIGARVGGRYRCNDAPTGLLGTHKLARWRASVPVRPDVNTMRVAIAVRGPLGLALVQSHVIEPHRLAGCDTCRHSAPAGCRHRTGRQDSLLLIGPLTQRKDKLGGARSPPARRVLGDDQVPRQCRPGSAFRFLGASASIGSGQNSAGCVCCAAPIRARQARRSGTRQCSYPRLRCPTGERQRVRHRRSGARPHSPARRRRRRGPSSSGGPIDLPGALDHEELAAEADDVLLGQRSGLFSVPGVQAAAETLLDRERTRLFPAPRRTLPPAGSWYRPPGRPNERWGPSRASWSSTRELRRPPRRGPPGAAVPQLVRADADHGPERLARVRVFNSRDSSVPGQGRRDRRGGDQRDDARLQPGMGRPPPRTAPLCAGGRPRTAKARSTQLPRRNRDRTRRRGHLPGQICATGRARNPRGEPTNALLFAVSIILWVVFSLQDPVP